MPTDSEFSRIQKIAVSIQFQFDAYKKKVVAAKIAAKAAGDEEGFQVLDAGLQQVRAAVNRSLDLLADQALSTPNVSELISALNQQVARARDELQQLQQAQQTLNSVTRAVTLATDLLSTVTRFAV